MSPDLFPRGFAEIDGDFKPTLLNLADGDVYDVGIHNYGEFFVNLKTGWQMFQSQVVPWDSRPCRVRVAERFLNAVLLKWELA